MHLLSALRRSDTLRSFTGLWLVAFLSFGPTLSAAIRTVDDNGPADYSSITAALAASSSGDTIQVAAGTYDGSIESFPLELKSGVAIVGAGRAVTNIVPNAGSPAFVNDDTPLDSATRLEGFTLTHVAGEDDPLILFFLGTSAMAPVITDNAFEGNPDESDGGIFIGGSTDGGQFTGTISNNQFSNLSAGTTPGPTAQLIPSDALQGGGIFMTIAPQGDAVRKHGGIATQGVPLTEDVVTPTITGNTFDGNALGIGVIGTYSYDYIATGTLAPTIDNNTFDTNGIDVALAYAGFGVREFRPSVTNNTSTTSLIHVAGLPYFSGGGGPPPSASAVGASPSPVSLKDRLRVMRDNVLQHRIGANAPRFAKKMAQSGRLHTQGVLLPPATSDITITGNTVTDAQFAGVFMYEYMYGGQSLDMRLDIANNDITGASLGGILVAASVTPESVPVADSISVQQNHVDGAGTGLALSFGSCSCAELHGSTNAALIPSDPANDIQVIGNILENGETGLEIGSDGYSSLAALVSCNLIQNNIDVGALIDDGSDPTPDFGGGLRTSPGKNSIHDNGIDMENDDADLVKAENNWWGTTNAATIEANTVDATEDPSTGDIDFDPPLAAEATDCIVSSGNADLALSKTVTSTGPYVVGSNITYQLTVTNNGPDTANNVVVTDPLPVGTSFVSASAGCSFASPNVTCTAASLANAASTSFDITVQATMEGSVINTATVDSDEIDSTPGNSTASAPAVPVGAAAVTPIPTASEWGLMLMGLMLAMAGVWFTRRGM